MKTIYLILLLFPLYIFGQEDKHEELRLKRHPLPQTEVVKKYLFDILQDETLVDGIAMKIFFFQYDDKTIDNIKRKKIKLYDDINVWEVRYFLGNENDDSIHAIYFIRFNKNTVEVIDKWIEK
ncbi:hypothetical protein [Myroides odoratus]|uniref:Uncharacterized protein n=1 Tax=Myroides odoratus TaxID=256 RepID=A0A9Q6Z2M4_MYROD|nr:hypothetical protein [Myroides odoratus]EHQ41273.1 hypothetical protein Myrod_0436 [Myroides odoratus DSM 2801]EKB08575.1 hypothetical protein HMPREF9716_00908 [Myroides odoratus CIP 103059]QQT98717.1 hypothetical protein I6I88_10835 [Myroides odoratus]WQD59107.1 hypothetical protein U0010_08140 [Myroides odoratus]STZ32312.1 Uncharacterised protein [Myroides odoratus]